MKPGDVVYLPSGSCPMTVLTLTEDIATVMWVDEEDNEHRTTLPREALLTEEQAVPQKGRR
jgi:hypothetical protein